MEIKYLGAFGLTLKGKKEAVVIDPEEKFDLKKFGGRLLIFSKENNNAVARRDDQVVIVGPGEYEVGGVEVVGINSGSQSTVYICVVDGVSVCNLGQLSEPLSDKKIERIENIDVLVVPLTGGVIEAKTVMNLAKKSGANYLIPVAYTPEELKKFLDGVDREDLSPVDNLKINRDELPEGIEVVLLKEGNS